MDERTPLLERVKVCRHHRQQPGRVRAEDVGGLKRQEAAGVRQLSDDGRTPAEQLRLLLAIAAMHERMTAVWEQGYLHGWPSKLASSSTTTP